MSEISGVDVGGGSLESRGEARRALLLERPLAGPKLPLGGGVLLHADDGVEGNRGCVAGEAIPCGDGEAPLDAGEDRTLLELARRRAGCSLDNEPAVPKMPESGVWYTPRAFPVLGVSLTCREHLPAGRAAATALAPKAPDGRAAADGAPAGIRLPFRLYPVL